MELLTTSKCFNSTYSNIKGLTWPVHVHQREQSLPYRASPLLLFCVYNIDSLYPSPAYLGEDVGQEKHFTDKDICKPFLLGICINDLFVNTVSCLSMLFFYPLLAEHCFIVTHYLLHTLFSSNGSTSEEYRYCYQTKDIHSLSLSLSPSLSLFVSLSLLFSLSLSLTLSLFVSLSLSLSLSSSLSLFVSPSLSHSICFYLSLSPSLSPSLFTLSQRAELPECSKVHSETMKTQFEEASKRRDYRIEEEVYAHLQSFLKDNERKIEGAKKRLTLTQETPEMEEKVWF